MTEEPQRAMAPPGSIKRQDEILTTWAIRAPAEHTMEQCLDPHYLWSASRKMARGDLFEIHHEAFAFLIRGLIFDLDKDAECLVYHLIEAIDLTQLPLVTADWVGARVVNEGSRGWCVRIHNQIRKDHFLNEQEAQQWLAAKRALAMAGVPGVTRRSQQ